MGLALLKKLEFKRPSSSNAGGMLTTEEVVQLSVKSLQTLAQDLVREISDNDPNIGLGASLGLDLSDLGLGQQSEESRELQLKLQVVTQVLRFKREVENTTSREREIKKELQTLQEIRYKQQENQLLNDPEAVEKRIAELQSIM